MLAMIMTANIIFTIHAPTFPIRSTTTLFHPSHTLTLVEERSFACCDNCGQSFIDAPIYNCKEVWNALYSCQFNLCVECALMAVISWPCGEGLQAHGIQHISHPHSLSLLNNSVNVDQYPLCNACGSSTFSSSDNLSHQSYYYYGCTNSKCNFFLHESCAGFPRQLRHPLHRDHGFLSLSSNTQHFWKCFLCERSNSSRKDELFLKCCTCSFRLCWSCKGAKVERRTIMYEGHDDHKLQFLVKTADTVANCNAYDGYCTRFAANCNELSRSKLSIFRCLDCDDFKLHMLCGPLPATIKHESHIHNLTLVDWLVEEDYDECYCDVCETKRDPRIRLYHCNECKYFAHVHCLISEIAKALTEEDNQLVELKIVGQDIWSFPSEFRYSEHKLNLTFRDVIYKLTQGELNILKVFYTWDDDTSSTKEGQITGNHNSIKNLTPQLMSTQDVGEILKLTRFTYSDFETFLHNQRNKFCFDTDNKLQFKSSDLELKTVNVEGYIVPHTVGRVMRALLHEYGDIKSKYRSKEWNNIVYFLICEVLRRMATILVIDITKVDLQDWYYHLGFAKWSGFKVDFACAHLEKLVRAFLGLQVDKLKDQVPDMLTKRIEKLKKKVVEAESQLEICKGYNSSSSERSQFMIDCLKESSDMKMKNASNGRDLFEQYRHGTPIHKTWIYHHMYRGRPF